MLDTLSTNQRAALLSVVMLAVGLLIWEAAIPAQQAAGELTEYERLTGGGSPRAGVPPPSQVLAKAWDELSNPFYDAGPNDKGIGIQIGYSLYRVLTGYFFAALIAIPLGFLIGMSRVAYKAFNPFIQVLRPISPLAWMPLALFVIQDSEASAIFVIFISRSGQCSSTRPSVWPASARTGSTWPARTSLVRFAPPFR